MEAPRGRYRVLEKDGRLVVIDNETGAPIPSSIESLQSARPGRPGASPSPVAPAGPGPIDRAADVLLAIAARERDPQGRAIIAWTWQQNGQERRWDAALDAGQQRRLGRALLAFSAAPLLLFFLLVTGAGALTVGMVVVLPLAGWGALSIRRLYRETNDPGRARRSS